MLERYIVFKGQVVHLVLCADGLWRDDTNACIYAFQDASACVDPETAFGVYPVALPTDHPLTDAAAAHDYAYSSPVYQLFHTREEADRLLYEQIKLVSGNKWYSFMARPFYWAVRLFGGWFWENEETRKKS